MRNPRPVRGVRVAQIGETALLIHPMWMAIIPLLSGLFALSSQPDPAAQLVMALQPVVGALCVLLHEAGHACAARALHLPVQSVGLLPMGGATSFARDLRPGREELCTSLAGLVASLVLVALALATAAATAGPAHAAARSLALFNAAIFAANALPALPLDGGRAARSLCWLRTKNAAHTAALVGRLGTASGYALGGLGGALFALAALQPALVITCSAGMAVTGWTLVRRGATATPLRPIHSTDGSTEDRVIAAASSHLNGECERRAA